MINPSVVPLGRVPPPAPPRGNRPCGGGSGREPEPGGGRRAAGDALPTDVASRLETGVFSAGKIGVTCVSG